MIQRNLVTGSVLLVFCLLLAFFIRVVLSNEAVRVTAHYLIEDIKNSYGQSNLMLGSSTIQKLGHNYGQQIDQRFEKSGLQNCGLWLNRGIGNSTISTLHRYLKSTRLAIDPPIVLLYAGENDISFGDTVDEAFKKYKQLLQRLIDTYPESEIHIIAIKPSPERRAYWTKFKQLNARIRAYVNAKPSIIFHSHVESDWESHSANFQQDGVHLTEHGYGLFMAGIEQVCRTR